MNILVTGANGFIGKAFIQGVSQLPHHVYGLDCGPDSNEGLLKQFFNQDFTQPFHIDIPFDCVFHLGALNVTHVAKAAYEEYCHVNVKGTENLIKSINTKSFVYMSTVKVYQAAQGIIDEESAVDPQNDYERSKFEAENICQKYFDEKRLTIFRSVNVVGPGQAHKAVIPVFFKKALQGDPLDIIYSPQTPLQMIHIDDLVSAFLLLLQKGNGGGVINLCSEEVITLSDLANEIVSICSSASPVCFKEGEQGNDVMRSQYASNRAQPVLGWKPRASVKDIIESYYKFISAPS